LDLSFQIVYFGPLEFIVIFDVYLVIFDIDPLLLFSDLGFLQL